MYITVCEAGEPVGICCTTQLKPRLCDTLEGWDGVGGGGEFQEGGTYAYLWLIHADIWQKPTQYCKAIILQLKINTFFKILLFSSNPT